MNALFVNRLYGGACRLTRLKAGMQYTPPGVPYLNIMKTDGSERWYPKNDTAIKFMKDIQPILSWIRAGNICHWKRIFTNGVQTVRFDEPQITLMRSILKNSIGKIDHFGKCCEPDVCLVHPYESKSSDYRKFIDPKSVNYFKLPYKLTTIDNFIRMVYTELIKKNWGVCIGVDQEPLCVNYLTHITFENLDNYLNRFDHDNVNELSWLLNRVSDEDRAKIQEKIGLLTANRADV